MIISKMINELILRSILVITSIAFENLSRFFHFFNGMRVLMSLQRYKISEFLSTVTALVILVMRTVVSIQFVFRVELLWTMTTCILWKLSLTVFNEFFFIVAIFVNSQSFLFRESAIAFITGKRKIP